MSPFERICKQLAEDRLLAERHIPCSTFKACIGIREPRGQKCPGCPLKVADV